MRRFVPIAALVAVATALVIPASAGAANDERTITAGVVGSPSKNAGTPARPRHVSLTVNLYTHDSRVPNPFPLGSQQWLANGFVPHGGYQDRVQLPKTILLNANAFPGCSQNTIIAAGANAPNVCPRPKSDGSGGSLLGTGKAVAQLRGCSNDQALAASAITEPVTLRLFKSPSRNKLIAQVFAATGPGVPVAVNEPIEISVSSLSSALYRTLLSFQVPDRLIARFNTVGQHSGLCISLRVVTLAVRKAFVHRFVRVRGRRVRVTDFLASSIGCSRVGRQNVYQFLNFVRFTDGFQFGARSWRVVGQDTAVTGQAPSPRVTCRA